MGDHRHIGVEGVWGLAIILSACVQFPAEAADFFADGVAAGDVTDTSVILWTRAEESGPVRAEVALDADFASGVLVFPDFASAERDATVKIAVEGLMPARQYFYRFVSEVDSTRISRTGRFRTAPSADVPAQLRFVLSGDSNFAYRPLTVAGHAALEEAELFIWFGDTMYGDVPASDLGVAQTLDQYRAKYRQIRSDAHIRDLLSTTAVWTGWDDHEVFNDYAGLDPAVSVERKHAAYQAFFEYMPIRAQHVSEDPFRTYRRFHYGSNIEFFMLDGRQYRDTSARDACGGNPDPFGFLFGNATADPACQDELGRPRQMLGPEQLAWLKQGLLSSTAATKFVVNNVPLTHISLLPYDRWDGYDAQRRELLEFIDTRQITGVVFLTTDTHANAYNPDVTAYFRHNRSDYQLGNGIRCAEIIAGPLGTETLGDELIEFASSLIGAGESPLVRVFLGLAENLLVARIREINRLAFIADDRIGYAVFDVDETGSWRLTVRGKSSTTARVEGTAIETLYSTEDGGSAGALPCCWPALMALGGMWLCRGRGGAP